MEFIHRNVILQMFFQGPTMCNTDFFIPGVINVLSKVFPPDSCHLKADHILIVIFLQWMLSLIKAFRRSRWQINHQIT